MSTSKSDEVVATSSGLFCSIMKASHSQLKNMDENYETYQASIFLCYNLFIVLLFIVFSTCFIYANIFLIIFFDDYFT